MIPRGAKATLGVLVGIGASLTFAVVSAKLVLGTLHGAGKSCRTFADRYSRSSNVVNMMGQPDIAGKFLRTTGNAPVSSEALGYSCGSRPTTDRVNVSGSYCQTVFFIKKHTMRLAAVSTSSSGFVGSGQIYSGQLAGQAENRVHQRARQGCLTGLPFGSCHRRAYIFVP